MTTSRHAFRSLLAVFAALLLALTVSVISTTPAQGDSNEGRAGTTRPAASLIAAGDRHSCALLESGNVWCWGANAFGQLGNGTTTQSNLPVKVVGLPVKQNFPDEVVVTALVAGSEHTCAQLSNGTAKCWGRNSTYQLGNAGPNSPTPVTVPLAGITSLSAGFSHTCAVAGGQAYCWGSNVNGALGIGSTSPVKAAAPQLVVSLSGTPSFFALGQYHSCVVLVGGSVSCWGSNGQGQLGPNGVGPLSTVPVAVPGTLNVTAITAGFDYTCISGGGSARCWGSGIGGMLGNGASADNPTPQPVTGLGGFESSIASGGFHACVRMPASLRCWGLNGSGELGNGTATGSAIPVTVTGIGIDALTVTAGLEHTCALLQSGTIRCWGENEFGQLGTGTNLDSSVPVDVLTDPGAPQDVSARPGDSSATISWSPPEDTGGTPIRYYKIGVNPGNYEAYAAGDATSYTVHGLGNAGDSWTFDVSALSEVGEGPVETTNEVTPSALPFYELGDVSISEGNSSTKLMTFVVSRFGNVSSSSSVKYATNSGDQTATPGTDYLAKAATLVSFTAGQTAKIATVTIKGDLLAEFDETFVVRLTAPVNGILFDDVGVGTIVNDDAGTPPTYSVNDVSLTEGNSLTTNMTFTVTRSGSTAVSGSVKYQTLDFTAVAGSDYTAKAPTLVSFSAGQTSKAVTVAIKGDLVAEPDEYVRVSLSSPVNGSIGVGQGYGLIINDDSSDPASLQISDAELIEGNSFSKTVTFTITRTGNLAGTSTVKYSTANGTAVAPGDYTAKALTSVSFSAGQNVKTVTVTVKGDAIDEPTETFQVLLSAPTGATISDGVGVGAIIDDD